MHSKVNVSIEEGYPFKWKNYYTLGLSLLFFLVIFLLDFLYVEERLLHEGGKELIGLINNESFFLLHPERLLMLISQIFPLAGIYSGCSLGILAFLFSLNLLFITFAIFLICLYLKDYSAGIFLCAFHVIGMGRNFFLYSFLEDIYALIFCYLLIHIINNKFQFRYKSFVIALFIILISSVHPPCVVYSWLIILRLPFSNREKISYSLLSIGTLLVTLIYTEISIESRVNAMNISLVLPRLIGFAIKFPDLLLLAVATLYLIVKAQNRKVLLILFVISITPYIFYYQLPTVYFALPCGFSLLFLITDEKLKNNKLVQLLLMALFIFQVIRIIDHGEGYKLITADIKQLITTSQKIGGSKFILIKSDSNKHYFENNLDFALAESIKHTSLLFSSKNQHRNSVIIESFDFNYEAFDGARYFSRKVKNEDEIVNFIESLYEDTTCNNLYEKRKYKYEYSKYFDMNQHLNSKYFFIRKEDTYKILH